MESTTWHYPPDFMAMMVDTIPLLVRSKADLLAFFRGAGVPDDVLSPVRARLAADRDGVKMFDIARHVLYGVNEMGGDVGLQVRREIVKRVTQFTAFDKCYENNAMKARGGVKQISDFVRDRDTVTRLHDELERERSKAMAAATRKVEEQAQKRRNREAIARDLNALFASTNPQQRGKQLESVLNRLFRLDGVLVLEDFRRVAVSGNGVIEQIDGVIQFDGQTYLVEMKWWNERLGVADVSDHMIRVFSRAQSRGIYIVYPGYTSTAVDRVREQLGRAPFVLCELEEVVHVLDTQTSVPDWLRPKVSAAIAELNPFKKFQRE